MRRREFIAAAGSAGVGGISFGAYAQHEKLPLVGFFSSRSNDEATEQTAAFLKGLASFGYVEGRNVHIEYRWASGRYELLPEFARELVDLRPTVIVAAGGTPAVRAAKSATATIPVLFHTNYTVRDGLVASLNRPGGNATGVDHMTGELGAKRVEFLTRLIPEARRIGFLGHAYPGSYTEILAEEIRNAARTLDRDAVVVAISSPAELERAFATLVEKQAAAIVVQNDAAFDAQRNDLIRLAAKHRLPAIYHIHEYPAEGGLMSYGPNFVETYLQLGVQTGRILKGAAVAELPVLRPIRFELVINAKTAASLGLAIPVSLIAEADEMIE